MIINNHIIFMYKCFRIVCVYYNIFILSVYIHVVAVGYPNLFIVHLDSPGNTHPHKIHVSLHPNLVKM